jgi:hypothetical protein
MKFVEIELVFTGDPSSVVANVSVPTDFYEWTEESQLKYLFNMRYLINHGKKTIYNAAVVQSIKIVEDV